MPADCQKCAGIVAERVRQNPQGYADLARRQPGAVLKVCPECVKDSAIHGADGFATDDPMVMLTPKEAEALKRDETWTRAVEVLIFAGVLFVVYRVLFAKKKS